MHNKIYVFPQGNIVYDGSILTEEEKSRAVAVDKLPIAENRKGYRAELRADKSTETVYYEYIDITHEIEYQIQQAIDKYTLELIEGGLL